MENTIKQKACKLSEHASKETLSEMLVTVLEHLCSVSPRTAEDLVERFDGELNYNNYLTETEAKKIVSEFRNQDGTHGAPWQPVDFFAKAESIGVTLDDAPAYNRHALYTTACMIISDHLNMIAKLTDNDVTKYVEIACGLAIEKLSDRDREKWIRKYFEMA